MKKFTFIFFLCLILTPVFFSGAETSSAAAGKPIDVYIFTQTGCPHCANAIAFLNNYKTTVNSNLTIQEFDLVAHREYAAKFFQFAAAYNAPTEAVPVAFVGDKFVAGDRLDNLKSLLDDCNLRACVDPEQYANDHPAQASTNAPQKDKSIAGYAVLGAVIVGAGLIVVNKFF